jgi:hypothetical protein
VVSLALRQDKASEENDHLHAAMGTRPVIDEAIGLIMGRTGAPRTSRSPSRVGPPRTGTSRSTGWQPI